MATDLGVELTGASDLNRLRLFRDSSSPKRYVRTYWVDRKLTQHRCGFQAMDRLCTRRCQRHEKGAYPVPDDGMPVSNMQSASRL